MTLSTQTHRHPQFIALCLGMNASSRWVFTKQGDGMWRRGALQPYRPSQLRPRGRRRRLARGRVRQVSWPQLPPPSSLQGCTGQPGCAGSGDEMEAKERGDRRPETKDTVRGGWGRPACRDRVSPACGCGLLPSTLRRPGHHPSIPHSVPASWAWASPPLPGGGKKKIEKSQKCGKKISEMMLPSRNKVKGKKT